MTKINISEFMILQHKIINALSGNDTHPNGWEKEIRNIDKEELPSIFYIGGPKSASLTLVRGFSEHKTAHWHDHKHFQDYNPSIKELINGEESVYDLVKFTSVISKNKPLVIESYREPIDRSVSLLFHQFLVDKRISKDFNIDASVEESYNFFLNKINTFFDRTINAQPFSKTMFNLLSFDTNQGYLYEENDWCKFLFLLYENIDRWENTIRNLGYLDYSIRHENSTKEMHNKPCKLIPGLTKEKYSSIFCYFKQNFKPSPYMIEKLFKNKFFNAFYTEDYKQSILKKYS